MYKHGALTGHEVIMSDLQRIILLVSLGTIALLLCLPACTDAQPLGMFQFDYDPSLEGNDARAPVRLSREQILRRLSDLAMSRSGSGPGYTIPRKRQVESGGVGLRLLGGLPIDIINLDEQLRIERDLRDRIERNQQDFNNAGRRR